MKQGQSTVSLDGHILVQLPYVWELCITCHPSLPSGLHSTALQLKGCHRLDGQVSPCKVELWICIPLKVKQKLNVRQSLSYQSPCLLKAQTYVSQLRNSSTPGIFFMRTKCSTAQVPLGGAQVGQWQGLQPAGQRKGLTAAQEGSLLFLTTPPCSQCYSPLQPTSSPFASSGNCQTTS